MPHVRPPDDRQIRMMARSVRWWTHQTANLHRGLMRIRRHRSLMIHVPCMDAFVLTLLLPNCPAPLNCNERYVRRCCVTLSCMVDGAPHHCAALTHTHTHVALALHTACACDGFHWLTCAPALHDTKWRARRRCVPLCGTPAGARRQYMPHGLAP